MRDFGYYCINADTSEEMLEDFKSIIKEAFDGSDGLYSVIFNRYESYKIISEVVYIIKYGDNVFFIESPKILMLYLDDKLYPTRVEFEPKSAVFYNLMYENDSVECLETLSDSYGNILNVFSFNEDDSIISTKKWIDSILSDIIDFISIEDVILLQLANDYLDLRIDKFKNKLSDVMQTGEMYEGFEDNPYVAEYYNRMGMG